jgi:hypothetical protein
MTPVPAGRSTTMRPPAVPGARPGRAHLSTQHFRRRPRARRRRRRRRRRRADASTLNEAQRATLHALRTGLLAPTEREAVADVG